MCADQLQECSRCRAGGLKAISGFPPDVGQVKIASNQARTITRDCHPSVSWLTQEEHLNSLKWGKLESVTKRSCYSTDSNSSKRPLFVLPLLWLWQRSTHYLAPVFSPQQRCRHEKLTLDDVHIYTASQFLITERMLNVAASSTVFRNRDVLPSDGEWNACGWRIDYAIGKSDDVREAPP